LYAYACMLYICLCVHPFQSKTIKFKNKHCSNVMICNDHDRAVLFCLQLLERRKREKQPTKRHTQKTHNTIKQTSPFCLFFCVRPPPCFLFIRFIFSLLFSSLSFPTFSFSSKVVSNQPCIAERDGKVAPKTRNQTIASLIGGHGWVAKRKERNEKEKKERKEK